MNAPSIETGTPSSESRPRLFAGLRTVGLWTLASRILGLGRDMGMAAVFGNGVILDAFSVAFRIPNLARRLFGEGALTAAFLPAFSREKEQAGYPAAYRFGTAMLVALVSFLSLLVLAGEVLLGIAWLTGAQGTTSALLVSLTALMLPYLVLICAAALVSTMLHAEGHFTWPALLPVIMNVAWILGLWRVSNSSLSDVGKIHVIATVVVASGIMQFATPLPALWRTGFRLDRSWRAARKEVRAVAYGMVPVLLGLSITQLNTLADSLIAWGLSRPDAATTTGGFLPTLSVGTASALYFGQRMYQFPLGIFGVALGTVMFPLLARHAGRNRWDRLRDDLTLGVRLVVFIGVPASIGLMLLAEPLTALLFQRGEFGTGDVKQTAAMIAAYGAAVWAYSGLMIVQRGFYAMGDRRTPLRAGLIAAIVNLVLDFALIGVFGGTGLAWATSIAAVVQVVLTTWLLQRKLGKLDWRQLRATTLRTLLGCFAMMATVLGMSWWLASGDDSSTLRRLLRVAGPIGAGACAYFLAAWLLRMDEPRLLFSREPRTDASHQT